VNAAITSTVERFSAEDWLKKHTAISDEDFSLTHLYMRRENRARIQIERLLVSAGKLNLDKVRAFFAS
jgi:hypothetical protein